MLYGHKNDKIAFKGYPYKIIKKSEIIETPTKVSIFLQDKCNQKHPSLRKSTISGQPK